MESNRISDLNECIGQHLGDRKTWFDNCELRHTKAFGCDVFATRDIEPNEVVFHDVPLMLGPMGKPTEPIVCVMCYRSIRNEPANFLCKSNCGLVICESSECNEKHKIECVSFQEWRSKNPEQISLAKMKALIVIRSLFLNENQKKFLRLMQMNYTINKFEMYFSKEFDNFPHDDEMIGRLRDASAAINTNAFQILYRTNDSEDVNVRAFYPIIGLVNHNCTPNTRRNVDGQFVSHVVATKRILKNEQIFTSYSQLLWGTNSRRMQLLISKQFLCTCYRCRDATECGTNLSAICCQNKQCDGLVLPIEAHNFKSATKCNKCEQIGDSRRYMQVQEIASLMVKGFLKEPVDDLDKVLHFLETKLKMILPDCSQFVAELKLQTLWKFDSVRRNDLHVLKEFCEDLLSKLNMLATGECSLKGFLAHKLFTMRQRIKEAGIQDNEYVENQLSKSDDSTDEDAHLWATAQLILKDAAAAPMEILSA